MKSVVVKKANSFELEINSIAPDKSISHRCAMFSIYSKEVSTIKNYLQAEDTLNTLKIVKKLGAVVEQDGSNLKITPPKNLNEPDDILDCGNSGTAMRLFCGFLSSLDGFFVLSGDEYLKRRPMARVVNPLRSIGAKIDGRKSGDLAPLSIRGCKLKAFDFKSSIASAQIKSAMILAGLRSDGVCSYLEPELTRDHTERMLNGMGANIKKEGLKTFITPLSKTLKPLNITVPADPSSAFFFAVATAITPNSKILLKNLTLNPTRVEAFKILKKMGVKIKFIEKENIYEPIGDILVEYNELNAVEVSKNISWLIDELPALSIAFALANGKSVVKNAKELRVKESDRISSVVENLKLCGVKVKEFEDGYEVIGGDLKEANINSYGDHRIAMSFAIAGLNSNMIIENIECIDTSFPNFFDILSKITKVNLES